MYSELVRNLEFLLKYSSKPSRASGLPLTTALNSRSLSKRFGSFWLRAKGSVRNSGEEALEKGSSGEQGQEGARALAGQWKEGGRREMEESWLRGGKKNSLKCFLFESREK